MYAFSTQEASLGRRFCFLLVLTKSNMTVMVDF
jgi:hypothetical protein